MQDKLTPWNPRKYESEGVFHKMPAPSSAS